jgi:hypothetical protein
MPHRFLTWTCSLWSLLLTSVAWSFEVTKNVNSGAAPVDKALSFDKMRPHEHVQWSDGPGFRITFSENDSIVSRIIGHGDVKPQVRWQPGDGRPASFDVRAYGYLMITCRLEGQIKTTRDGKISESRPDNLWLVAFLFKSAQERVGSVGLADLCPDGRTPDKTTELKIPLMLLHKAQNDSTRIVGVGFTWSSTRENTDRDFRLVIDRISLAD